MKKTYMNRFKSLGFVAAALFLCATAKAQQYQDGNVYQHWDMPVSAWNVDTYMWAERISDANFFAQVFKFENNVYGDDGAYIGLQQLNGSASRLAKFSIWNATSARAATGGTCRDFGGEGIGKTCDLPYRFSTGQWYRLRVWALEADANGQWWGAWVIDSAGNESHIGSIRAPLGTGRIADTSSFNEYFGPAAQCNLLPSSGVYVYNPILNAGQNTATIANTSIGACAAGDVAPLWNGSLSRLRLRSIP